MKTQFIELIDAVGHQPVGYVQFSWSAKGGTNFQTNPEDANTD